MVVTHQTEKTAMPGDRRTLWCTPHIDLSPLERPRSADPGSGPERRRCGRSRSDTGNLRSDLIAGLDDVRQLLSSPLGTVLLDVARSRDDDLDELRQSYWRARLDQ